MTPDKEREEFYMTYRKMLKTAEIIGNLTDEELGKLEDDVQHIVFMCRSLNLPDDTVINVLPLARLKGETVCRMTYGDVSFVYYAIMDECDEREHRDNEGITWCRLNPPYDFDEKEAE